MGIVVRFPRHARASAKGYKSGRSSWRGTPVAASTAKTFKGGTQSHCEMACGVMESAAASLPLPPADLMARSSAIRGSVIASDESIASHENQASLHWRLKAVLYNIDMTLGKRIQAARKRLEISHRTLGDEFGISPAAVSAWERDETIPEFGNLCRLPSILKVPADWLLTGGGAPPLDGDLAKVWDRLDTAQRAHAMRYLDMLASESPSAPKPRQKAS